jgi:hypothetical protein
VILNKKTGGTILNGTHRLLVCSDVNLFDEDINIKL